MKNGLVFENDELIYYVNDKPYHAGVIQVDGAIYYISSKGKAVKGQHIIHRDMSNGILARGTYNFGDDYKLVKGSFVAPKKKQKFRILKRNTKKRSPRGGLRDKLRQSLKKKKNRIALAVVCAFLIFLAAAQLFIRINTAEQFKNEPVFDVFSTVKVELPTFEEDVLLCSQAAKLVYDGQMELKDAVKTGDPYRPFYFEYSITNGSATLLISEHKDMKDAREYALTEEEHNVAIDNLKVDTDYYYRVKAGWHEYNGSFHTAASTRFVSIPGLVNTRDIGGYETLDGKKVKQGLLIRGVELDGLVNAPYFIPEEELENVQETFGFVYDLDLRSPAIYNGEYIPRLNIPHKFYDAPMYGAIFTTNYRNSLRQIFTDLANPVNYPMYLHCTWGRDRTGTVVFLLQGILNVSEEDMVQEYKLTGYVDKSIAESNNMEVIINGLKPYAGDTLQEKIVSFLTTDIGITHEQIESIRDIFLEA